MIITVTKATWLGKSRVEVEFEGMQITNHLYDSDVLKNVSHMTYDDLHCIIEKLGKVIEDVYWESTTQAPSWFIEKKRQIVFENSKAAKELFGFDDNDIATIAAVFTNNLAKPVDIVGWMVEDATPEIIQRLGLARKVAACDTRDFAPPRFVEMCKALQEKMK